MEGSIALRKGDRWTKVKNPILSKSDREGSEAAAVDTQRPYLPA